MSNNRHGRNDNMNKLQEYTEQVTTNDIKSLYNPFKEIHSLLWYDSLREEQLGYGRNQDETSE